MSRSIDNILKRYFRVLHRDTAAFTQPASAADFTTFLGTFTETGFTEDKSLKITVDPNETLFLDNGKKHFVDETGKIEFALLQSEMADHTVYDALHKAEKDYLFYAEEEEMCIFVPAAAFFYKRNVESGSVEKVTAEYERMVSDRADLYTQFAEPTS